MGGVNGIKVEKFIGGWSRTQRPTGSGVRRQLNWQRTLVRFCVFAGRRRGAGLCSVPFCSYCLLACLLACLPASFARMCFGHRFRRRRRRRRRRVPYRKTVRKAAENDGTHSRTHACPVSLTKTSTYSYCSSCSSTYNTDSCFSISLPLLFISTLLLVYRAISTLAIFLRTWKILRVPVVARDFLRKCFGETF